MPSRPSYNAHDQLVQACIIGLLKAHSNEFDSIGNGQLIQLTAATYTRWSQDADIDDDVWLNVDLWSRRLLRAKSQHSNIQATALQGWVKALIDLHAVKMAVDAGTDPTIQRSSPADVQSFPPSMEAELDPADIPGTTIEEFYATFKVCPPMQLHIKLV
jgi:hypothetical protein